MCVFFSRGDLLALMVPRRMIRVQPLHGEYQTADTDGQFVSEHVVHLPRPA